MARAKSWQQYTLRIVLEMLLGVLWPARMAVGRKRRSSPKGVLLTAVSSTVVWYLISGRRESVLISRGPQAPEFSARIRDSVALTLARLYRKRSSTSLEFFEFGRPSSIELPSPEEIRSYDDA